jgi:hypothetical protein
VGGCDTHERKTVCADGVNQVSKNYGYAEQVAASRAEAGDKEFPGTPRAANSSMTAKKYAKVVSVAANSRAP